MNTIFPIKIKENYIYKFTQGECPLKYFQPNPILANLHNSIKKNFITNAFSRLILDNIFL